MEANCNYRFQMVEVKPGMRSRFVESGELCAEFPYRAKALFAFEEIDGTDICFFGMHVQVHKTSTIETVQGVVEIVSI